jgi:hypothetical protein
MNSDVLKPAQVSPRTEKQARDVHFAQRTLTVRIYDEESLVTIHCLTDKCTKPLLLSYLRKLGSLTMDDGVHTPANSHRP